MPKAGSKAIQHFSFENQDRLKALGYHYPTGNHPGNWHRNIFVNYNDEQDARLKRLCKRHERVILSFERGYVMSDETVRRMCSHADELYILFLVREPVSWVNSWINQIVKNMGPNQQFANFSIHSKAVRELLSPMEQLARWEAYTVPERITVREFDPKSDVVVSYLDWLKVPETDRAAYKSVEDDPNKGLDPKGLRVFLEVNRRAGDTDFEARSRASRVAFDLLDQEQEGRPEPFRIVDDRMADDIVNTYQRSFDAAFERYCPDDPSTSFAKTRASLLSRPVMQNFEADETEVSLAKKILEMSR